MKYKIVFVCLVGIVFNYNLFCSIDDESSDLNKNSTLTESEDPYLVYNPIVNNNGILVACYSNKTSTKIGSSIVWSAEATGATGNFTYTWSGSEGLSGNQSSIPKIYYTSGIKNASVIATASNGQSIVQQCSNTVNVLNNTKTPAKASVSNTPTPTPESNSISNSLIALKNVPWILVSILVILVLMFTVIYLIFNRNKI